MLKQSKKAPQIHGFISEQEEVLWRDFWDRLDDLEAFTAFDKNTLPDWVRRPRLTYKLMQLKVTIKKLNRAFGRG